MMKTKKLHNVNSCPLCQAQTGTSICANCAKGLSDADTILPDPQVKLTLKETEDLRKILYD